MAASIISVITKSPNLLKELQKKLPHISFHKVENAVTDEQFKKSHIIIGDFNLIGPHLYDLHNVKWIQGTWAGVDLLLKHVKPDRPPTFPITRFTGRHFGTQMTEYVVSQIINQERDAFKTWDNQKMQEWSRDGKIWTYRTLPDLTIGILGLGTIGFQIAKSLNYMGAKVIGLRRRETLDLEKKNYIEEYYTVKNLNQFLQSCDYVVNVLPSTIESKGLLDGNVLESCKERDTVFINIGRGSIITEKSLVNALECNWVSAAILDVFEKEPLKGESPLWKMPNVVITPHVSGVSRPQDVAELMSENLKFYEQNLPIPGTVDFASGY
ncbi:hypothetical protein JTB14_012573 [Gonioctena quinquepunctata]|nr:hypothetical protein JTB14_012573 [Gonioctena quinquepunctata]